jgi:hypothetical protein
MRASPTTGGALRTLTGGFDGLDLVIVLMEFVLGLDRTTGDFSSSAG